MSKSKTKPAHSRDPEKVANNFVTTYFLSQNGPDSIAHSVRRWLLAIPVVVVIVPIIFYLEFGEVGPIGWGLTVFFVVYCLLAAIGLYLQLRPDLHSTVPLKGDWVDRVGAFWLMSCAFGPLMGWALTSVVVLTVNNWRWLYWGRAALCVGLPIITSLALVRYVRGRGALVALGLLVGVTALPIWSSWNTIQDLRSGPIEFSSHLVLPHTRRAVQ